MKTDCECGRKAEKTAAERGQTETVSRRKFLTAGRRNCQTSGGAGAENSKNRTDGTDQGLEVVQKVSHDTRKELID